MIRTILPTILISCATASAAAPGAAAAPALSPRSPSSSPAAAATATSRPAKPPPPAPQELHEQAVDALRAGKLNESFELMERAFDATPSAQRTRPLVLNRAILDLTQRVNVMRAVRDTYQYLRANPQHPDEQALNILGAALNVAADNPRWKKGTLWQSAFKEWERQTNLMNDLRPGYRRWGTQWLTEAQFQSLQEDRDAIDRAIDAQASRVDRATTVVQTLQARHLALVQTAQFQRQQMSTSAGQVIDPNAPIGRGRPPDRPQNGGAGQVGATAQDDIIAWAATNDAATRAQAEITVAIKDRAAEVARLADLRRAKASLRPMWPATFEPIAFDALTPPPPPPPDPKAMAELVEQTAKEKQRIASPFGESGMPRGGAGAAVGPPQPGVAPAPDGAVPTTAPAAPESPFVPREIDQRGR
jgi:hypothetical protein